MSRATVEFADFGGINSRENPLRLSPGKALRQINWRPLPNGVLQLRHGYTRPTMTGATDAAPIHSAAYYELHSGVGQVLYSQGSNLRVYNIASASVTTVSTISTLS